MSVLISTDELKGKLKEDNVVLIDVRGSEEVFPGAVRLDEQTDLTGKSSFMPKEEEFAEKLSNAGISNETTVVIFDEGKNRVASKAWFVFHYIGHENVAILQGGYDALVAADITIQAAKRAKTDFVLHTRTALVADIEKVKAEMDRADSTLIDSREYQRYLGKVEPKYAKAGHIPGAENYHAAAVFTETGTFKEKAALKEHFKGLEGQDEVIVSCGSGASACMNLVALKAAGFDNVKLYPGGFSEWISDDANEVEKD